MKQHRISVKSMAFTAIMAALICIAAPFSIPMPSAVPISLATFAVYLSGALLGKAKGCAAVAVYILLGTIGLPVFSGFIGGVGAIAGLTGGYIIGYVPCAFLTGLFAERSGRAVTIAAGMLLGTLVLYSIGTVWFTIVTGTEALTAITACVLPYLPADVLKIAAATALSVPLRKKLRSAFN